jgi:very-short-patch-repair endonuclease
MVERARELRRHMTSQELRLWSRLRKRNLDGSKFRRQAPVGPYVVDFLCHQAKLVVEVDGDVHDWTSTEDGVRTALLQTLGFDVVRLTNHELAMDLDSCVERIRQHLRDGLRMAGTASE